MSNPNGNRASLKPGDYLAAPQALHVEQSKIIDYLLNLDHAVGKSKAKFFLGCGFTIENWEQVANALRDHAKRNQISKVTAHDFGTKYIVECPIISPTNDSYCIRVVWNDHRDGNPAKFITAHPLS